MKEIQAKIHLKSDVLIGSGEGFATIIDTDIIFDELGIPYIPSKRIKGILRDSATEVLELFVSSQIKYLNTDIDFSTESNSFLMINELFGKPGQASSAPGYFENFYIENYSSAKNWFNYAFSKSEGLIDKETVLSSFTSVRRQTTIDQKSGTAKKHSLRTIRTIRKGNVFTGKIRIDSDNKAHHSLLLLALKNACSIGTKRNRGLGEISIEVLDSQDEFNNIIKEMEADAIC